MQRSASTPFLSCSHYQSAACNKQKMSNHRQLTVSPWLIRIKMMAIVMTSRTGDKFVMKYSVNQLTTSPSHCRMQTSDPKTRQRKVKTTGTKNPYPQLQIGTANAKNSQSQSPFFYEAICMKRDKNGISICIISTAQIDISG